ncbi:GNAT family N-acetyltransferase [Bacillus massilinigeriensis]|uniref:GNAT family N-acetyltransferase n=1 Tax=Bacillus mediterraneensis TaxID=1805474 RepID=UPI0008F951EE|nr:GNAT family protein [Bacillus mediterraneensis]
MKVEEIYGDLPVLETERLILRKVTLDDAEDMFKYGSNEEVTKYVTWNSHKTLSETKEYINLIRNNYEQGQVAPWGMECKETGEFIGTIDFVWWLPDYRIAEIGYVISQDYWGKGLTTEAAREVMRFGFDNMELIRIQAKCLVENTGSARVMEKAGMTFEGVLRNGMFLKGKSWDLKMYSIIEGEI